MPKLISSGHEDNSAYFAAKVKVRFLIGRNDMNDRDCKTNLSITERCPVFALEKKVNDNLYLVRLSDDEITYAVRLYPFALFEVTGEVTDTSFFDIKESKICEVKPFTYFQPLLILTTSCTLKCTYCYAYEGSYGMEPQTMDFEVLDRTVEYLRKVILESYIPDALENETTELGLICFGGEPLIALPQVMRAHDRLTALCRELSHDSRINFVPTLTINTNGYEISGKALDFFSENASDIEVVVSYDGLYHDKSRRDKLGGKTAEKVFRNIMYMKNRGVKVTVTSCLLPEAVKRPKELMASLAGIYKNDIPLNPSFIRGPLEGVSDRALYPGLVQEAYDEVTLGVLGDLIANEIESGARIYSDRYRRRLLEGGYRYRCGAGLFEFAVAPDGSVYPCHNFVSDKYVLGDIRKPDFSIPQSSVLVRTLFERRVGGLVPCGGCIFQSTCMSSFDCPAHSLQDLKDINVVDQRFCGFARKVQKSILKIFIKEMHDGAR